MIYIYICMYVYVLYIYIYMYKNKWLYIYKNKLTNNISDLWFHPNSMYVNPIVSCDFLVKSPCFPGYIPSCVGSTPNDLLVKVHVGYPLVNIQKAIENGPVEIVDLPSINRGFPYLCRRLPEGRAPLLVKPHPLQRSLQNLGGML